MPFSPTCLQHYPCGEPCKRYLPLRQVCKNSRHRGSTFSTRQTSYDKSSKTIALFAHRGKRKRSKIEEGGLLLSARHSRTHKRNSGGAYAARVRNREKKARAGLDRALTERASSRADPIAKSVFEEPRSATSSSVNSLSSSEMRMLLSTRKSIE